MNAAAVALVQGVYFVVTAAWPLIHLPSFLRVTGPKTDLWLVRTVGALLLVIGVVLILASHPGGPDAGMDGSTRLLGVGSAITLLLIDVVYVLRGTISRIYLLDAALELAIIGGWLAASTTR